MNQPFVDVQLIDGPVALTPLEPFPPECGAECVFLGRTRTGTHAEHGRLTGLQYDAHRSMAKTQIRELVAEAIEQFDCRAVRIHHAIGAVPIGQASVVVQVACGHRAAAFEACRYLIDKLKHTIPIWKREDWADGSTWAEGVKVQIDDDRGAVS